MPAPSSLLCWFNDRCETQTARRTLVRLAALGVDTGYRRGMRVGLQDLWTGQWRSQTQTRLASLMLSCF